jgi:hypothetical protein
MRFAKLSEIKPGDMLITDGGFTCIGNLEQREVQKDDEGRLFISCADGRHYLGRRSELSGDDTLVGLSKVADLPDAAESDGWEWAVVEVFGHRRHAGRTREEERFGAKLLRIDVPVKGDAAANGWRTVYYGGSSIFSFSLSDEATCNRINKPYEAPSRVSLPAPQNDADEDEFGNDSSDRALRGFPDDATRF